jgi:hypothetical protein
VSDEHTCFTNVGCELTVSGDVRTVGAEVVVRTPSNVSLRCFVRSVDDVHAVVAPAVGGGDVRLFFELVNSPDYRIAEHTGRQPG